MPGTLRIMSVAEMQEGSDSRAIVSALMRMGHSLIVIQEGIYFPIWHSLFMRGLRRVIAPLANLEINNYILRIERYYRPHLFLVCKGCRIKPNTVIKMKHRGVITINWYPDISFLVHRNYIPKTLPHYDWVFTTESFGIEDMKKILGVERVSLLPHGYDPEIHFPWELTEEEKEFYGCDVSFIGTWSPKKQKQLEYLVETLPKMNLKIWGEQWRKKGILKNFIQGHEIMGREYAKAIRASKIALALLSEVRKGASSGDLVSSRTFKIPVSGGFMLHEKTTEVLEFYKEDEEIACFSTPQEMAEKIKFYLAHEDKRIEILGKGMERCRKNYSVDKRFEKVIEKYWELKDKR